MSADRGRLAPSPTGGLHAGNVRTLMLAWLSVRAAGGAVILRVEDIDRARCKPEFTARMLADLHWLGFDWDEGPDTGGPHAPYLQSQRLEHYRDALRRLIAGGWAYPCICSRAELASIASAPHGPAGPVYPGRCRDRFDSAAAARAVTGRAPAWRFDSRALPRIAWSDCFRPEPAPPATVDDFVLWRADDVPSYQLAVVVDDLAMGVTEVVRGDDLIDSTPRQLAIMTALTRSAPASPEGHTPAAAGTRPRYYHVPLVLDEQGQRLAKRAGATQVAALRALGVRPEALIGFLAHGLGLQPSPEPSTIADLVRGFRWAAVPRHTVQIHEETLRGLA